jgi:hypothetical protein
VYQKWGFYLLKLLEEVLDEDIKVGSAVRLLSERNSVFLTEVKFVINISL